MIFHCASDGSRGKSNPRIKISFLPNSCTLLLILSTPVPKLLLHPLTHHF